MATAKKNTKKPVKKVVKKSVQKRVKAEPFVVHMTCSRIAIVPPTERKVEMRDGTWDRVTTEGIVLEHDAPGSGYTRKYDPTKEEDQEAIKAIDEFLASKDGRDTRRITKQKIRKVSVNAPVIPFPGFGDMAADSIVEALRPMVRSGQVSIDACVRYELSTGEAREDVLDALEAFAASEEDIVVEDTLDDVEV